MAEFQKIVIITGHYGCGKTNLAVNIALYLSKRGEEVAVVDLDIVNPYFRTYDCKELFDKHNIKVLAPNFASTNLDIPSLPGSIYGQIRMNDGYLVLDVGGDDAGAVALGQYVAVLEEKGYEMLYVYNSFRYLTANPEETAQSLRDIEAASRLKVTGLVNNANLGPLTTKETVQQGIPFGRELSKQTGLPVKFTSCAKELAIDENGVDVFPLELYIKPLA